MSTTQTAPIKFAAIGLDHRHIYEQVGRLLELGCECAGYWTEGEPQPLGGFIKRFPHLKRVENKAQLLEDASISLVVTAGIPDRRAGIALEAMRHGKDIMIDKPGCTSLDQLAEIRTTAAETGRIWSVNFSERFEVRAVMKALELARQGRIGQVVQTVGLGPHRLNKHLRPDWFFQRERYGGVLCDIASHQIDQFLMFTNNRTAEIVHSTVANYANPETPELEDFGELVMHADNAHGYVRVDWYTPDGLANWGDGRLTLLGTDGYMELRKYIDIGGKEGTDHLFLVDGKTTQRIDCSDVSLSYYGDLINDVRERSETAMSQEHCFKVTELALIAQAKAQRLGHLV